MLPLQSSSLVLIQLNLSCSLLIQLQDLEVLLEEYCNYHMYQDSDRGMLMEGMLQAFAACDLASPMDDPDLTALTAMGSAPESIAKELLEEFAETEELLLKGEQQVVFNALLSKPSGLSVVTGPGGSNKTLLIGKLTHELRKMGKNVVLAATTGAAAINLSDMGVTAHSLFSLPIRGQRMRNMPAIHPARQTLLHADVIVIDEMSMLTAFLLSLIAFRLKQVTPPSTIGGRQAAEVCPFAEKHIILVGDLAQVGNICCSTAPEVYIVHSVFIDHIFIHPTCVCKPII